MKELKGLKKESKKLVLFKKVIEECRKEMSFFEKIIHWLTFRQHQRSFYLLIRIYESFSEKDYKEILK